MPPALKRLFGDGNDLFDLLLRSHLGDLPDDLIVRRVGHLKSLARLGRDPFIVDKRLALQQGRVLEVKLSSLGGHCACEDGGSGGGVVSQSVEDGCHER